MKLEFRELTKENWEECAKLTDKEDSYVYPNTYSIAEAQFYLKAISRAIYVNESMVGYAMYGEDEEESDSWAIDRFMISKDFRRSGYGSAAIKEIIKEGKKRGFRKIITSTAEKNLPMRALLIKIGFETNLEMREGEVIYFIEE